MKRIDMPENWKSVLKCRSVGDKFAIPRDCALCPVEDLPAVSEMVREGIAVWIDRCTFRARINDAQAAFTLFDCDIYQLTLKGIKLCNEHGIKQS